MIQNGGSCRRAGAGAAGKCLSGSSFPDPHLNGVIVQYLDKFCVDSVRKIFVMLKFRADLLNVQILHIVQKDNRMRISHGHRRIEEFLSGHRNRLADHSGCVGNNRNLFRLQNRTPHIHADRFHLPVFYRQIQRLDSASGADRNPGLVRQSVIIHIFCHTANPVPAHSPAGSIRVVHVHLKIRHIGRLNQNQPIRSDSEMPVTDQDSRLLRMIHLLCKTVDIDIIIAASVHLCKFHSETPFFSSVFPILSSFTLLRK